MKIADRAEISPFYVMEVMKAAADRERVQGNVLHLEVGQPSTPAPQTARFLLGGRNLPAHDVAIWRA